MKNTGTGLRSCDQVKSIHSLSFMNHVTLNKSFNFFNESVRIMTENNNLKWNSEEN